jgi:hypothetical protein
MCEKIIQGLGFENTWILKNFQHFGELPAFLAIPKCRLT